MNSIMCGFAQNVISPSGEGIFMDGYGFRLAPADGIHDDLYVKAAVFQDATGQKNAILSMDNIGLHPQIYHLLTEYIEMITGYKKEQIALCSIHSHSAPAAGILDGLPINYDYWCQTAQICAESIMEAEKNLCTCTISTAIADKELLSSVNRRNRPFNDRRIKVVTFTDEYHNLRGVLVNANCHPVINTTQQISADYPQILTRESLKKYHVPFLFLLGRSADINPHPDIMKALWDGIELLGKELTDNVFATISKASRHPVEAKLLKSRYKICSIPMKPFPTPTEMKTALKNALDNYTKLSWSKEKHYALRKLEWHRKMYQKAKQSPNNSLHVPIQTFALGDHIIFVFLPFEILTLTGNKIEDFLISLGYSAENIFIVSCANSVNGYLPPSEEFPYGGYEVSGASSWYGVPDFCEDSEKEVVSAAATLAEQMTKEVFLRNPKKIL